MREPECKNTHELPDTGLCWSEPPRATRVTRCGRLTVPPESHWASHAMGGGWSQWSPDCLAPHDTPGHSFIRSRITRPGRNQIRLGFNIEPQLSIYLRGKNIIFGIAKQAARGAKFRKVCCKECTNAKWTNQS